MNVQEEELQSVIAKKAGRETRKPVRHAMNEEIMISFKEQNVGSSMHH